MFCQTKITIQGTVRDQATREPLAYVNISLLGTSVGTVSNQSGNFTFNYASTPKGDTVVFSYLGYKPFWLSLTNVTDKRLEITLEPHLYQLEEIVVKPLDPLDVVYKAVSKIPQNYNFTPHTVGGFQREYVKKAPHFIQLLEVAFQTESTAGEGGGVSTIVDARYMEDKKAKEPLYSASRGGFYTFGWSAVSGMENPDKDTFLGVGVNNKSDLASYYEFEWKEPIKTDNKQLHVIGFDQRKNGRRALLKGTLYIDAESYAIVKVTYGLSPRGIKRVKPHQTWGGVKVSEPPKKIDIKQDRYQITYKQYGSKWYLSTLITDSEFDASLLFLGRVLAQQDSLVFHSERIVTWIDTTGSTTTNKGSQIAPVGSISTLQNYIKKRFENYEGSDDKRWTNVNSIPSDTSFALIAKQLQINNKEWEAAKKSQVLEKAVAKSHYSSRQLKEDVEYLQESLEKVHPGLYWYTPKTTLDKEFASVKEKLKKSTTEAEFFQSLSPLIEKIHCGHTRVSPSLVRSEYKKLYTKLFPLDLWIRGDSAFVTSSYDRILKGPRVLSINGHPMPHILERIKAGISSDGFNRSYKEFLLNGQFPSLFAAYFSSLDTFSIEIGDSKGEVKEVKVIGKSQHELESRKSNDAQIIFYDSLQTALLTIPSFSGDEDLPTFFKQSFEQIQAKAIQHLIIDLRNNEGGKDEHGRLLFSYLANESFGYYKSISVATIDTSVLNRLSFGDIPFHVALPDYVSAIREENGSYLYTTHANLGLHQADEIAFKGKVYILINGGTFSTAADFAAIAHSHKRAVFIGEETGGGYYGNCSLGTPTLTLPHSQIRISVPIAKYELLVKESNPAGRGVIPHHPIEYRSGDILEKKDKELEFCFQLIGKDKNGFPSKK